MRTHPETFATRSEAERVLWRLGSEGRADRAHDRRFRALVLLATFASLRWGEVAALRRSGFNTRTRWVDVVKDMGMPGLHFHDLRHTGNMLAAESGAGLKDLMARMGHDNVRAAMIYQHAVRGADKAITDAIDRKISSQDDDGEDGAAGVLVPVG
jgi:integrase